MDYFQSKPKSTSEQASEYLDSFSQSAKDAQFQAEGLLGLREKTTAEEIQEQYDAACPALSYQTRFVGFCACFCVGLVLMFLADTKIRALISGDPAPFGVYYTFANVVGILGSFFMSGPTQQARKMTEGNRLVSTLVYVCALVATLFFVFYAGIPTQPRLWCILVCILVQYLALLWYTLSFVPYAQAYVCGCFKACLGDLCCGCCDAGGACEVCGADDAHAPTEASPLSG